MGFRDSFRKAKDVVLTDRNELIKDGLFDGFTNQHEDAIEKFDRVIHLSTNDDDTKNEALFLKSLALQELEEYAESNEILKKLINDDETDDRAWHRLGYSYFEEENFDEALKCFEKCIELDPDYQVYLLCKAQTLVNLEPNFDPDSKLAEEALKTADEILGNDSEDEFAFSIKCQCLLTLDRNQEIIDLSNKIKELEESPYYTLATAYSGLGNVEKALENIERAIQSEPDDSIMWYNKACYLSLLDRKDEALDALLIATSVDPENLVELDGETDFRNIKETERFQKLLNTII
jgi:tetratricopeptide (TPR) repeat protein